MRPEQLSELLRILSENEDTKNNNDAILTSIRNSYRFSPGFTGKVMQAIQTAPLSLKLNDLEIRINSLFMKVAFSGVAAIILLAISVFISGGTLSFDSLLGLGNSSVESMICLLSGN